MNKQIRYYQTFQDDFVQAKKPGMQLDENYRYKRHSRPDKWLRNGLWKGFRAWSHLYFGKIRHVQIANPELIEPFQNQPCFLYASHTQPILDPFLPALFLKGKFRSICMAENLSIPILGHLLPLLGALPIGHNRTQMQAMKEEISYACDQGEWIIIYPEAHVWPWYDKIRPFEDTSFQFALDENRPCFASVLIYKSRDAFLQERSKQPQRPQKPDIYCELAGPFYPDPTLPRRKARKKLRNEVYEAMCTLSKKSDCAFIEYQKASDSG